MAKNNKQNQSTENSGLSEKKDKAYRFMPNNPVAWIIAVSACILVFSVGTYVIVRVFDNNRAEETVSSEPENPRFPKQEVRLEQLDFAALQTRVGQLELSNQYTDAKKLVKFQNYYEKNKQAQLLYASLCANQGSKKEALQTMLAIEKQFGESGVLAGSIAQHAIAARNKEMAIEYYKKAIRLTENDRSNPVRKADASLFREKLKELEEN